MNFYPAELVTPPLALVALLGRPDLHAAAGEFLRSQHRPPINSIGVAEPASAARLFGERKAAGSSVGPSAGIIKADWFAKHRQRRPAVAVVFLDRNAVVGDPGAWARACSSLEAVRSAAKARGARVVVAIVQEAPLGADLPDDRASMLARQAAVDRKCLVPVCLSDGAGAFRALGAVLYEQAAGFYADDARRVLQAHAERKNPPPEANARTAFKAAALAEFRADWTTAARMYATAYNEVLKVSIAPPSPIQRHFELAACAELFHIKVVTLLLHQRRLADALTQFRSHLDRFRRPAELKGTPPAAAAAHAGWLARQHAAMAELLSGRADPAALPEQGDSSPAALYLAAANAAIDRRRFAAAARTARAGPPLVRLENVSGGRHVGTHMHKAPRPLSDAEYADFLELQEGVTDHPRAAIELLALAHELYKRGPTRPGRLLYHLGGLMAREYLAAGDAANAGKLLESVSGLYRKEGWTGPLAASLLELRECAHRQGRLREHVAASLEVAALPRQLDPAQAAAIANAAVATLTTAAPGDPAAAAAARTSSGTSPTAAAAAAAMSGSPGRSSSSVRSPIEGMHFAVGPSAPGLAGCFALAAGFVPPADGRNKVRVGIALWSNLPAELPVSGVTVELVDREGVVSLSAATAADLLPGGGNAAAPPSANALADQLGSKVDLDSEGSSGGVLQPGQWRTWAVNWDARHAGRLQLASVTLSVSAAASFSWSVADCPQAAVMGSAGEGFGSDRAPFSKASGVQSGGWAVDVPSRHAPPSVKAEGAGYAIVGERAPLTFVVRAGAALSGGSLTVSAVYREGLGQPTLFTAPASGEDTSAAAEVKGPIRVAPIAANGTATVRLLMAMPRQGQLRISGSLSCNLTEAPGDMLTATAALDITVEVPFSLQTALRAPPGQAPLLLPAPGVSTAAALGGADGRQALPLRQPCLLTAALRVTAPCEIVLEHCAVEPPLPDPGEADIVDLPAGPSDAALSQPARLRTGDIHTGLFTIQGGLPAHGASLGTLLLRWRRAGLPEAQPAGSPTKQQPGAERQPPAPSPASALPASPAEAVETRLPLPAVDFAEPLVSVAAAHPAHATAGAPFRYALTLRNHSPAQQQLHVAVGDTTGFVFAGGRQEAVAVLPHSDTTVAWQLVPITAGSLPLPAIRVTAAAADAALDASAGRRVFVVPSATAAA